MTVGIAAGISAYTDALKRVGGGAGGPSGGVGGIGSLDGSGGGSFADMLKGTVEDAISTQKSGETAGIQAATGKADINSVISAVTNAELSLQTVVAVRDKVVAAYQQILQMPI